MVPQQRRVRPPQPAGLTGTVLGDVALIVTGSLQEEVAQLDEFSVRVADWLAAARAADVTGQRLVQREHRVPLPAEDERDGDEQQRDEQQERAEQNGAHQRPVRPAGGWGGGQAGVGRGQVAL